MLDGARSPETQIRNPSWDALVGAYWKPAYRHLRAKWHLEPEDAADVVQSFFLRALEKGFFHDFDPARARFRTFLRVCLDRHTSSEAKARSRIKRGGDAALVSLPFDVAEAELASHRSVVPDEEFEREWRRSLFTSAVAALRAQCEQTGKETCFTVFERYDLCEDDATADVRRARGGGSGSPPRR